MEEAGTTAAPGLGDLSGIGDVLSGLSSVLLYALVGLLVVSVVAEFVRRAMESDDEDFDVGEWRRENLRGHRDADEYRERMRRKNEELGMGD